MSAAKPETRQSFHEKMETHGGDYPTINIILSNSESQICCENLWT